LSTRWPKLLIWFHRLIAGGGRKIGIATTGSLQWATVADKFVGMYVNHWTLDYGDKGRESIRRFLGQAFERGLIPHRQELEFVV